MTHIVIPIKNPSAAKQRLGELLNPTERRDLALALMDHVLSILRPVPPECEVLVVTDSADIESRALPYGVSVLREDASRGEAAAVEAATRRSCAGGFDRQMVIPADMPCVSREDILSLLAILMTPPSVVLCPAAGDDGTNAIATCPPDALTFRFGSGSFRDYVEQARRRKIACRVHRLPNLVLDLDTPNDLRTFLEEPRKGPVHRLLSSWNLRDRVAGQQ